MVNSNLKTFSWKLFKGLANLKLALFILFTIIVFCIVGSVVEQDQDINYYLINYSFYSPIIFYLGLDHVFRNWWFILILFVLVLSLLSCSFVTQLPSLKNARRWKFMHSSITQNTNKNNYAVSSILDVDYSPINIIYSLLRLKFLVFCRGASIYSYKGLYGRIAPIFVHLSIILILLGSVYGFSSSFVLQEIVPVGEIFHFKNIVYSGFYSNLRSELFSHVDNFYIEYGKDNLINQFFSNISVYIKNRKLISHQWLSVNKPLYLNKVTFYQTDWEMTGLRLRFGKNYFVQKKLIKKVQNNNVIWVANFYVDSQKEVLFLITNLNGKILVSDTSGLFVKEISLGQRFYINSLPISIENIIASTGLQIKFDPGIPLVYSGFFMMIVSTFISYLSYSQIWIYRNTNFLEFFGSTNRAVLFLEQDIIFVDKIYSYYLSSTFLLPNTLNNLLR